MKQYVTIFSFLILFLIPSFLAYAEEKYQDNFFGYSMNVPEEYTISQSLHNVIIITSENKNQANGIDNINILVTAHNDKPFSEMVQRVKNDIKNFGNEITDEIKIDLGRDNIGDVGNNQNKATLIKSYTDIGVLVFTENVIAYHEDLAYFITVTYTDESTHDDFHDMLESFEFATDDFIPQWIRIVSERWATNDNEKITVSDEDFAHALRYVLSSSTSIQDLTTLEKNIHNNDTTSNNDEVNNAVIINLPSWLKIPTSSWINGDIDNDTWKNLIVYLYENEIIVL